MQGVILKVKKQTQVYEVCFNKELEVLIAMPNWVHGAITQL